MMIKLDSLAVLAKPAMSAKIRVKINCHSPSIEKKGEISFNSYICEHVRFGQKVSLFIVITKGKYADSVLISSSY